VEIWVILYLGLFRRFKDVHMDVEIELISFNKLKAYFVKKLQDSNSFIYKYHQEMVKVKVKFNNMHTTSVHHEL
jgi:hypothetical protein